MRLQPLAREKKSGNHRRKVPVRTFGREEFRVGRADAAGVRAGREQLVLFRGIATGVCPVASGDDTQELFEELVARYALHPCWLHTTLFHACVVLCGFMCASESNPFILYCLQDA